MKTFKEVENVKKLVKNKILLKKSSQNIFEMESSPTNLLMNKRKNFYSAIKKFLNTKKNHFDASTDCVVRIWDQKLWFHIATICTKKKIFVYQFLRSETVKSVQSVHKTFFLYKKESKKFFKNYQYITKKISKSTKKKQKTAKFSKFSTETINFFPTSFVDEFEKIFWIKK